MKILSAILLLFALVPGDEGYKIIGNSIEFIYRGSSSHKDVYVSGNFNEWAKAGEDWKMNFDAKDQRWTLKKPVNNVRSHGSFLEFTFRVDGKLLDADPKADNVIHCAGYGYRYVIR